MSAPSLSSADVRQEIEQLFRRSHRSRLVALFGRGEAEHFEIDGKLWQIVPTRCELDLRERLPRPEETDQEGRVFLVDWTHDVLPLDVACRLAGGRIYHVARDARLATLFGARQIEAGLAGTTLARLLLAGAIPTPRKIQGMLLTRDDAWQRLLEARFRVPEAALGSLAALLSWARASDAGPAFLRQSETDDLWRAVRRELHAWLLSRHGEASLVVWSAWEQGKAARLGEVLLLLEAARDRADSYLSGMLAGQLAAWLPELAPSLRLAEQALLLEPVLDELLGVERKELLALVDRSQALAQGAGLGDLVATSRRLPGGHLARERAMAEAVRAFLVRLDSERAEAVLAAQGALEAHGLDPHLRSSEHREARTMMARLVVWMTGRGRSGASGPRWQPAVDLARRYAEEGGHLEWARQAIRGLRGADDSLQQAARELGTAVGDAQRGDHRAFAEAYVAWLEAGKPASEALPIEEVSRQVIAPFLQGDKRRRLLVVLMDGMSQATAVQLLTRLGEARRWGPMAWRKPGWKGVMPLPPVLAVAPTLTEISRSAFFAGMADPRFGGEATEKDVARWRANKHLAAVVGEDSPELFLRKDILAGHELLPDLRKAIDGDSRVVAVVVNAVDEELGGSLQVAKDYSVNAVLPLESLLSAAEGAERAVLLIADHGHVLGDGARVLSGRLDPKRPGGPRWRALRADEVPSEEEMVLPPGGWVPRGWDRVAVLWDPSLVYRSPNYGEHGGLSMAEVVAPAILIAPDWLERTVPDDPELAVRAFPVPDWWALRVKRRAEPRPPEPFTANEPQPTLFAMVPTPEAPQPASPFTEALRRSAVFQAQVHGHPAAEVSRVLEWLSTLLEAGGSLPALEFAAACGVRNHLVSGVVARMGMLNADGFAMIEHDHVGRRVVVNRARLVQHYGVKE
jgi:hypothetical protein